jgi:RND family efflux transporter MFP subunit
MKAAKGIFFIIFLALLSLSSFQCDTSNKMSSEEDGEKSAASNTVAIGLAEVVHKETSFPIHSAGMVSLEETVKLAFKVGGIVDRIFVDESQSVNKDQVLAVLDLSEIGAQVNKAQSAFSKAERDLNRVRVLFTDKAASLEQLQDSETAYEIALSELKIARFNLEHSTIIAPANGKILKRFAQEKELVPPGTPLLVFASTDKNWVIRFGVTDKDVVRLNLGDTAEVHLDVFPDAVFKARVSEVAEAADSESGTFEVELEVDEAGYRFISGFIAKVDIYPALKRRLAFIPVEALIEVDQNRGHVFTVNSSRSRAVKLPVRIHRILNDGIAVSEDLDNVQEVVTSGASYLIDGSPVEIIIQNDKHTDRHQINPRHNDRLESAIPQYPGIGG